MSGRQLNTNVLRERVSHDETRLGAKMRGSLKFNLGISPVLTGGSLQEKVSTLPKFSPMKSPTFCPIMQDSIGDFESESGDDDVASVFDSDTLAHIFSPSHIEEKENVHSTHPLDCFEIFNNDFDKWHLLSPSPKKEKKSGARTSATVPVQQNRVVSLPINEPTEQAIAKTETKGAVSLPIDEPAQQAIEKQQPKSVKAGRGKDIERLKKLYLKDASEDDDEDASESEDDSEYDEDDEVRHATPRRKPRLPELCTPATPRIRYGNRTTTPWTTQSLASPRVTRSMTKKKI